MIPQPDVPALPAGDAIASADGNFYFLESDKILKVSRLGVIDEQFKFTKHDLRLTPVRLDVSDGYAAIELIKPDKDGATNSTYLVLDLLNHSEVGWYAPTPDTGTDLICYTRQDGFIFARVKNDHLELRKAGLK